MSFFSNANVTVSLRGNHNHSRGSESVKYRTPSEDVHNEFVKLFKEGKSPSEAIDIYKKHLRILYDDDFHLISADRSIIPSYHYVYHQYENLFKAKYGPRNGVDLVSCVEKVVRSYNDEMKGEYAVFHDFHDDECNFAVVIQTPLMKRISEHCLQSKEVLFIDSTGTVDRFGCRVFLLITNSCIGGLPVGVFMTTSETEIVIEKAASIYKDNFVTEMSFCGNGKKGPAIIMSDDCTALQTAMQVVFPEASLWLCNFHLLQNIWRNLFKESMNTHLHERQSVFALVKKLFYFDTVPEFETYYKFLSSKITNNDTVSLYIEKLYNRKHEWAMCFAKEKDYVTRGQYTNNLNEAANRILKERALQRTKAYTPAQLLEFIFREFTEVYRQKLVDCSNGRLPAYLQTHLNKMIKQFHYLEMSSSYNNNIGDDNDEYEVKNTQNGNIYTINTSIGMCTCFVGSDGQLCKHQLFVSHTLRLNLPTTAPITSAEKENLMKMACDGEIEIPSGWFAPLTGEEINRAISVDSAIVESQEIAAVQQGDCTEAHNKSCHKEENNNINNITSQFETNMKDIIRKSSADNTILKGMAEFNSMYTSIKLNASLASALHSFGKYWNGKRRSSSKIYVQPTAIERRKSAYKGHNLLTRGRTPKRAYVNEHGYNKTKGKRSAALPHSLSECVLRNVLPPK